jgi:hypothetical protein
MNDVRRRSQPAAFLRRFFLGGLPLLCAENGYQLQEGQTAAQNPCEFRGAEIKKPARAAASLRSGGISFALFAFRDFLAIDSDIAGSLDADSDLRTVHRHHGHLDIVADAQALTSAASQN